MIFLSTMLRQSVYDSEGRRLGGLRDVSVALNETFPVVTALVVHPTLAPGSQDLIIPWSYVQSIEQLPIRLTVPQAQLPTYTPQLGELLLRRDILDKQIVDTQGFRVVKVNDLKLAQIKKTARLVGVDISLSGLLRRLGVAAPFEALGHVVPFKLQERTITWNYVEPIQVVRAGAATGELTPALATSGAGSIGGVVPGVVPQVQLNVSHTKLADLHPADIADILEQLDVEDAGAMLDRLDTETAADTLNEVEYPHQSEILSELDPERASDLLEHLAPDDAADILADIPPAEAEHLLNLMPAEESRPIRELLRYGAETAGGIMTTEVLSFAQDETVEDALRYLRQHSAHLEMVYYLYIVDEQRHLVGVVSLRQLVTAEPTSLLRDLMDTDVISVRVDADQEEVARIIAKYDLLGVPVVDEENRLVGLVTVDDVIDVIHEEQAEDLSEISGADVEEAEEEEHYSWRTALSRFSWLVVSMVAGFVLAIVLYNTFFSGLFNAGIALADVARLSLPISLLAKPLAGLLCLVPMLLLTSGSAASQALGVAGWRLRTTSGGDLWRSIGRELLLGTTGGVLTSLLSALLTQVLFRVPLFSVITGISFGITLLIATCCGLVLPNLLQRFRLRGSLIAAPLLDPVIAVISLSIFLAISLPLVSRSLA
jgi:magnesium transporter